jgi:hypothetical protein
VERTYGSLQQSNPVTLQCPAKVDAKFDKGIIHLPKPAELAKRSRSIRARKGVKIRG